MNGRDPQAQDDLQARGLQHDRTALLDLGRTGHGRPTWRHVITHEVNKSSEEVRSEIEARERGKGLKPLWVYHRNSQPASEQCSHRRRLFAFVVIYAFSQGACRYRGWLWAVVDGS